MGFHDLRAVSTVLVLGLSLSVPQIATAADQGGITIISATFGVPNSSRPVTFTDRLQRVCGNASTHCEAYCSPDTIGSGVGRGLHIPFSPRPVCRVTYRCGEDRTLAVDVDKNDVLVLSCQSPQRW